MQHICLFTGARPNFVKVAPIIRAIKNTDGIMYQLVYAGRDDDSTLEDSLFDDLQMPRPDVFLGVDCENLNELTGRVMSAFEQYLERNATDTVIVVDDLASTRRRNGVYDWLIWWQALARLIFECQRRSTVW